jgi:hypothetical protein
MPNKQKHRIGLAIGDGSKHPNRSWMPSPLSLWSTRWDEPQSLSNSALVDQGPK